MNQPVIFLLLSIVILRQKSGIRRSYWILKQERLVGKASKRKLVPRKSAIQVLETPNPASGTETYIWAVNKNDAKVNSINKNDDYYVRMNMASRLQFNNCIT